jgi:hypothetical protein
MDQAQVVDIITAPKNFSALANLALAATPFELVSFAYSQKYCTPVASTSTGKWRKMVMAAIEQTFVFAGTVNQAFTLSLPAYSVVDAVAVTYDTAIVLATAVKVGVGTGNNAGNGTDSNLFLSGTGVTANSQFIVWPTSASASTSLEGGYVNANSSAAAALYVNACATGGSSAGTITSGTIRVNVLYRTMQLPALIGTTVNAQF